MGNCRLRFCRLESGGHESSGHESGGHESSGHESGGGGRAALTGSREVAGLVEQSGSASSVFVAECTTTLVALDPFGLWVADRVGLCVRNVDDARHEGVGR